MPDYDEPGPDIGLTSTIEHVCSILAAVLTPEQKTLTDLGLQKVEVSVVKLTR